MPIEGCSIENPENMLDQHVLDSQGLLTAQALKSVVLAIPLELRNTNQARYLAAIVQYNTQHEKVKRGEQPDWEECLAIFEGLEPTPLNDLDFYVPNYCFLAARNAGKDFWGKLPDFFQAARLAAENKDEEKKSQLLGFLIYNYSRHLLQNERRTEDAKQYYIAAGRERIAYFKSLKNRRVHAEDPVMQSAATQVWKIRQDWSVFFGQVSIGECPVGAELFSELEKTYIVNPKFSATS